jgi:hypothetical protein
MSLFQCPDCGGNCSSKAVSCPGCGRMVRGRGWWAVTIGWGVIMSAVISFIITAALTIGLIVLIGGFGALSYYTSRPPEAPPSPKPSASPPR